MRKYFIALVVSGLMLAFAGFAMAFDVAISTQAGWFSQAAADKEMAALVTAIKNTASSVTLFPADKQADLATWVKNNTSDNAKGDLLILNGQCPSTIYKAGNTQKDDSLIELFLDAGNTIINTGDYFMYVVDGAGTNGEAGVKALMDDDTITMWDDDTPVVVTADGKKYCPSLKDYTTDRPFNLTQIKAPWTAKIVLAQNAAKTRAEPVILENTKTGGMVGTFYQTASQDADPRAKVMGEFINSYYATTAVQSVGKLSTSWGEIKR